MLESVPSGGVTNTKVSVGTSATKILDRNPNRLGFSLQVRKTETASVYIGSATVTTDTGHEVYDNGDHFAFSGEGLYRGELYGIVTTGTVNVRVMEFIRGDP